VPVEGETDGNVVFPVHHHLVVNLPVGRIADFEMKTAPEITPQAEKGPIGIPHRIPEQPVDRALQPDRENPLKKLMSLSHLARRYRGSSLFALRAD
jgi:hypothetical protein